MEQNFEKEVITRLTVIETKLDDYSKNKERTEEAYNLSKVNEKEIDKINSKIKWLLTTILGAIITGLVGIAIAIFKNGIGV